MHVVNYRVNYYAASVTVVRLCVRMSVCLLLSLAYLVIKASQFVRRKLVALKPRLKIWQILPRSLCFRNGELNLRSFLRTSKRGYYSEHKPIIIFITVCLVCLWKRVDTIELCLICL